MDRGAWWAAVQRVTQSCIPLSMHALIASYSQAPIQLSNIKCQNSIMVKSVNSETLTPTFESHI